MGIQRKLDEFDIHFNERFTPLASEYTMDVFKS